MEKLEILLTACSDFVWGVPLMALLFGSHLFFTVRLRFPQRKLARAIRLSVTEETGAEGEVSPFGALATALAATLGTGNIVGVALAVSIGGPGAVFWCWITGVFGMATKYAESFLAVKYRKRTKTGGFAGGPMYVMEKRFSTKLPAVLFSLFTIAASFGTGSSVQSNAIGEVLGHGGEIPFWIIGMAITIPAGAVILGGAKKITRVCQGLIPAMAALYLGGAAALLVICRKELLPALSLILKSTFSFRPAAGGLAVSLGFKAAREGIARGLFSDESGLGTAPMAAAAAKTSSPVNQALAAMTGTFWDTVVFCAVTGILVVAAMLHAPQIVSVTEPGNLAEQAFGLMGRTGNLVFLISLTAFAFATILGWNFYGEQAVRYLFPESRCGILIYRLFYLASVFCGAIVPMRLVWQLSDLFNGLMAVPNLLVLLLMQKEITEETANFRG